MRIDLLLSDRKGYSYENLTRQAICKEFEKKGIEYKTIFFSDGILHDYMQYLHEDPPFYLLSFHYLLTYDKPFCDIVHIPQFVWVQDSLAEAASFLGSQYGKIGLPRPSSFSQVHFLPHGINHTPFRERMFDVVIFSPLLDLESLQEKWKEFYPLKEIEILQEAILHNSEKKLHQCTDAVDKPTFGHMIKSFETFLRASRLQKVIPAIKHRLDIFGEHIGNNWGTRLPLSPQCLLRPELPYSERFTVLSQSKIVLVDPLDSSLELQAAAGGCLPIKIDQEDVHEKIAFYLDHSQKREKALESYYDRILNFTWEKQTNCLLEYLYES